MKRVLALSWLGMWSVAAGVAVQGSEPAAPDLLGSSRTQILARLGRPLFAPRLGDEDEAEQFHVGDWDYIVGYRADKADPANSDKMKVICLLKKHDFGSAQSLSADEIRMGLMEARNSQGWKPFQPLPFEINPKPGEKDRDFETLHYRKPDGVLTAKGQTTRRRQRLFVFTLDWHGLPTSAPAAWFLDLPADRLEEFFRGSRDDAETRLKLMPVPSAEHKELLRGRP